MDTFKIEKTSKGVAVISDGFVLSQDLVKIVTTFMIRMSKDKSKKPLSFTIETDE